MMASGYFLLSVHSNTTFFIALFLIILGNGFFKPNISTLVGNLYSGDDMKDKKDAGYNIFYMCLVKQGNKRLLLLLYL